MTAPCLTLRSATPADLPAITAIYAHHVAWGRASFETAPPPLEDMQRRFAALAEAGMPYLVAEEAGQVLGYAYAGAYRPRAAYQNTVENSIYVAPGAAGRGLGRRLLAALITACEERGFRQMIAVVGDSGNTASIRLHEAAGFTRVGTLRAVGRKHGEWLDVVLLQRPLGEADATPPAREPA
ncbi:GNAT family N-acetyltransferase [Roseomonas sp. GC11]|uniref:GNAT family N-acetyltransferase n=1 Tax=Roseomonas sp. GC11 TaxID=2950546 RepID=UPI00210D517F|nr:GNAT family N-acetyltransferase [Roseomonas sp. GC11]MCQ4162883.1 GNAT family N-acetyltransferase [Roseomonas sp. GC11]